VSLRGWRALFATAVLAAIAAAGDAAAQAEADAGIAPTLQPVAAFESQTGAPLPVGPSEAGVDGLASRVHSTPEASAVPAAAPPPGGVGRIEHAWRQPAGSLEKRVTATRRASLELGVWNLDAAARAVLSSGDVGGTFLDRSQAAVRLAPDLPAGRMALAEALWLDGEAPMGAIRAAFGSLAAIPRHLEASMWFAGTAFFVLGLALVAAGAWCILLIGGGSLAHAAHDLGDLGSRSMPGFARAALLASVLLLPLAFGEGFFGLCLALMGVGVVYGDLRRRLILFLAASVMILGSYPLVQLAGNTLTLFVSDPVAEAAFANSQGFDHPVDRQRIESAALHDPLAAQALAARARRAGRLGEADRLYQGLLEERPHDAVIANNAANVRLNLGHIESALALYESSVAIEKNPVALFNLSQAHGRAFQVEELSHTLAAAQRVDGQLVAELTALQGAEPVGFVVDLPVAKREYWLRILRSYRGERIAGEIRAPMAPGALGRDSNVAVAAFGAALLGFSVLGSLFNRSVSCERCGTRICRRCDPSEPEGRRCRSCTQLQQHSETTDRELRLERLNALRAREERLERRATWASIFVPGVAGLLAQRPVSCLLGSTFAILGLAAIRWRHGIVPDPLVAGPAAPFAALCLALVCGFGYVLVVLVSVSARRKG